MPDPDRFAYLPITERPLLRWPNGARIAVWVCPNIEHYEFLPGPVRVRDPWPRTPHPDVLGYGMKDYGNRVGLWRLFEVLDRYAIRCTVSLNLANFEHYPEILEACERRGWDYMCHGIYNTHYLWDYPEDEERAFVQDCVETFRRLTGRRLAGWFSPAASHTLNTPDLVAEAGIKYFCDFYHDDQPTPLRVRSGRLISLPYQMDLNDSNLFASFGEGPDFARMSNDMFDTLYHEGAGQGRVMCLALHPFIMGRPHRLRWLDEALRYIAGHDDVWFATGEEIADWYYATAYDAAVEAGEGR
jgi:peptidoglycan/xylan/chitin deacetylase (PgdA/CDA1 family)